MKSYSIALLFHAQSIDHNAFQKLEQFRRTLPFASMYLYCDALEDSMRSALQKLDIILRKPNCRTRFQLVRRMFTEVDADIFVYCSSVHYTAEAASQMIHQLVETRKDMIVASGPAPHAQTANAYQQLCSKLYGIKPAAPLSDFRVFSRRFVKSFSAYERGFPIELEWTIHSLELDIPQADFAIDYPAHITPEEPADRQALTRLILNLQSRPLKWFGVATAVNLALMLVYALLFLLGYAGIEPILSMTQSAMACGVFAILAFVSALSGLTLHSISHQRREIKRLHFQQHSTL